MGGIQIRGTGSLRKRKCRGGYRWCAALSYKTEDGKGWRGTVRALTDEEGKAIVAMPDRKDPNGEKVVNNRNRRKAEQAMARLIADMNGSAYDRDATVEDYYRADMEGRAGVLAGSTARGYMEYAPIIGKGLEGITISKLDQKAVRLWVRGMVADGKAPSTIRKAYTLLHQVCDRAVENGDMTANPCTDAIRRAEIPTSPTKEPNALDSEGVARVNALLNEAKNPRLRVGARIALHCGLRAGEISGLRWRDVGEGALRVRESIANVGGGTEAKAPKSYAGTRDVPMTPELARELAEWRKAQEAEWRKEWVLSDGKTAPETVPFEDCRVIGYADGRHFTPNALGHLWNKLAKGRHERDPKDRRRRGEGWEPGREPVTGTTGEIVTLHDLRHTFATHHIAVVKTDVRTLASLMGHADPAVTMRRYAAALAETREAAQAKAATSLAAGCRPALRVA